MLQSHTNNYLFTYCLELVRGVDGLKSSSLPLTDPYFDLFFNIIHDIIPITIKHAKNIKINAAVISFSSLFCVELLESIINVCR